MPKAVPVKPKAPPPEPQADYAAPRLFPLYKHQPLELEERVKFREFMGSNLFRKLIHNAYCYKPASIAVKGGLDGWNDQSESVSSHRLHQIQGWEMFEAAFFRQAEEVIPKQNKPIEEQYQTPGT